MATLGALALEHWWLSKLLITGAKKNYLDEVDYLATWERDGGGSQLHLNSRNAFFASI